MMTCRCPHPLRQLSAFSFEYFLWRTSLVRVRSFSQTGTYLLFFFALLLAPFLIQEKEYERKTRISHPLIIKVQQDSADRPKISQ